MRAKRAEWLVIVGLTVFASLRIDAMAQTILTPRQAMELDRLRRASIQQEGRGLDGLPLRERRIVALRIASLREEKRQQEMAASAPVQPPAQNRPPSLPPPLVERRNLVDGFTDPAVQRFAAALPDATLASRFLQPTTRSRPTAERVPGKPGIVVSPFAPEEGYVDVRGLLAGTEVRDPYSGRVFVVP